MIGHSSCIRSDEESQHDQTMSFLMLVMITDLEILNSKDWIFGCSSLSRRVLRQRAFIPESLTS